MRRRWVRQGGEWSEGEGKGGKGVKEEKEGERR